MGSCNADAPYPVREKFEETASIHTVIPGLPKCNSSGFGGLEDACWPLVPKFTGSNPAEAVGFFKTKNPQHAFLRRGSKAGDPMS
jgi:hypothetical protein